MDHLGRDVERRFRRDEDDASPIALQHALQIGARHAHAGHDIDLEETVPILVADLEKVLRLEDAGIVDENVDLGKRSDHGVTAVDLSDIAGDTVQPGRGNCLLQTDESGVDAVLSATVEHDLGTRGGQSLGDGKADAGGRSGDESSLAGKVDVHAKAPS